MNNSLLADSARAVRAAFPRAKPVAGLILGSGWRSAAADFQAQGRMEFRDIPALGSTTVSGHDGALLWGNSGGVELFVFLGRRHWYEGAGWEPIAAPVYLLKHFGARMIMLTNAAGGIRADLKPGALMVIDDHINAMGVHPLLGPHDPFWGARFPDQSQLYDPGLRALLDQAAAQRDKTLAHGMYAAVSGPTYETPAEIRALRTLGADVVGMSTVPEAILAHAAGLRVCGLSVITNMAAGLSPTPLSHDDVKAAAAHAAEEIRWLLQGFWAEVKTGCGL